MVDYICSSFEHGIQVAEHIFYFFRVKMLEMLAFEVVSLILFMTRDFTSSGPWLEGKLPDLQNKFCAKK